MATYTYRHHPGYGSTDHLAAEVIARAARILGIAGAAEVVHQAAGYAAHAAPMRAPRVVIAGPRAKARAERAINQARAAMPCRVSCCIAVEVA